MNAKRIDFDLVLEGHQVEEVIGCLLHTIVYHRTTGKFVYEKAGSYRVGTVGYEDIDCDSIHFTYVRCSSEQLCSKVTERIAAFSTSLRASVGKMGEITLEFYNKKKNAWLFSTECNPWEVWIIRVQLATFNNDHDKQAHKEKLEALLVDKILYVCETMNKEQYVPGIPECSELDTVFDTSITDVQPYLFKITQTISGASNTSYGTSMKKLLCETLSK